MTRIIDLSGRKFGRWTVVSLGEKTGKHYGWNCICDCGNSRLVSGPSLRSGLTTSCGCRRVEVSKQTFRVHGMANTRLNRVWAGMKARCYNPNNVGFKHYGARGISVCERWQKFENFLADMGPSYEAGLTLDRRDNDLGYEPGNCRWATRKEQCANRRRKLVMVQTSKGEMTIGEAADAANISTRTMRSRIQNGWGSDRILSPLRGRD